MTPAISTKSHLAVNATTILVVGFLIQFALPLVVFGSTAVGALLWVAVSFGAFILPNLLFDGRLPKSALLLITTFVFLPPAIFIGAANLANMKVDGRATADLVRSLYFLFAFIAGVKLASRPESLEKFLSQAFKWITALLLAYMCASFFMRDMIDDVELFYGKFDNVVSGRLFVPFPNPYDLALFCTLPIFYYILNKKILAALTLVAVLVATQSRTGILLFAIGLILCFITSNFSRVRTLRFALLLTALTATVLIFVVDLDNLRSTYLIANTLGLIEGQSTTLSRRFAQWSYVSDLPLLGWGTVRSSERVIENAVIYELYRTGALGIYSIFCFYILPACLALKALWLSERTTVSISFAIFVLLTVIGFSSSVFIYQPKLSLTYWFAVGALFSLISRDVMRAHAVVERVSCEDSGDVEKQKGFRQ